jgi:DNA-binding SARP family transcriptional activator
MKIRLLGGFGVEVGGTAVPADTWRHRRAAELVKLLALAPGGRLHREQAMDALWPDLGPEAGAANLRKAIHFARRALGRDDSIVATGEMVQLAAGTEVDARAFEEGARAALGSGGAEAAARAAGAYAGDLLPEDRFAPWAEEPRERLRLRYVELLRAARMWEPVLEVQRDDEEAHRALIQAALDRGDRATAIRRFETLRETLRTDLGVGPDRDSVALYEKALAIEGGEPLSTAQRARALLAWGLVHLNTGDLAEAERTAEEARALAIDAGLGREIGDASALLGMVANARGRWREVFGAEFARCVRAPAEHASLVFDANMCLAEFVLCADGGPEAIGAFARELLGVATDAGSIHGRALATLMIGEAALFAGRLEEADEQLAGASALYREAQAPSGRAMALERLAEVAVARGQRWRAGRLLGPALRLAGGTRLAPHLLVRIHGAAVDAAADPQRAMAAVRRADAALAGQDVCIPCAMGFRVAASIALARAGDADRAGRRLAEAERVAGMWQGGAWDAAVWEARGELRRAQGDTAQAVAMFKEAAGRFASAGRPLDEARCRAAAGA